jgi:Transposase DDE domain group 1
MRWRKADLGRRVNGNLELRFGRDGLTSYAGLELVRRYLVSLRVVALLRRELGYTMPHSDFGAARMVLLVLALIISGGRRLRHILFVAEDPVVLRLCGLTRMPTPRTVGRWLGEIRATHLPALQRINGLIAARAIHAAGLRRLTIDVDGSVVSTGLQVEWAQRGFNPHRRKVPSYYPITAYEAQSGQVLRVQNRPGNVHDGKASQGFLSDLFAQIESTLGAGYLLEFRMDGAYFRREIIDLLDRRGAEYAIKVPFYPWVGLKRRVEETKRWTRVEETVSCAEHEVELAQWGRSFRVVIYRRRVKHETAKNFQLDLFDPSDGHYEYSAVVTNKSLSGPALWSFMSGRGVHEKVYGELKGGFAFDCVPTMKYAANSACRCSACSRST